MITVLRDSELEEVIGGAYGSYEAYRSGRGCISLASIETRVLTSFFDVLGISQRTQIGLCLLRDAGLGYRGYAVAAEGR